MFHVKHYFIDLSKIIVNFIAFPLYLLHTSPRRLERSEKPIPGDVENAHTPPKYLRWRVDKDELAELSSLKVQGYWRRKDMVEFVDYLMQLGDKNKRYGI
ncbi:MAG: hypothetical protein ABFC92_02770 [Rectinema sp.]